MYFKYDSNCAQNSAHILEEFIGHLLFSEYNECEQKGYIRA